MSNLTMADVNNDVSMLIDSLSSDNRLIPSSQQLFKLSFAIPVFSLLAAFLSDAIGYLGLYGLGSSSRGYYDYFLSDGVVVIVPTAIIGIFFAFMTYNNLVMYMTIPADVRRNSIILSHLRKIAQRTVVAFLFLMFFSAILSVFKAWFALAIPALEFALLLTVSIVVGAEINRLGAGLALEKISNLLKKI